MELNRQDNNVPQNRNIEPRETHRATLSTPPPPPIVAADTEPSSRLPRRVWRKVKKKQHRSRIRQKLARLAEEYSKAILDRQTALRKKAEDEREAKERAEQRLLWEIREQQYEKQNAERRRREEAEKAEKERKQRIKESWEKTIQTLAQNQKIPTMNPIVARFTPAAATARLITPEVAMMNAQAKIAKQKAAELAANKTFPGFGRMDETDALAIVVKNMYKGLPEDHSESDRSEHFEEFCNDVRFEFLRFGRIVRFEVCQNEPPHLKGNVYVEYSTPVASAKAAHVTHGRWYGGQQLGP
ncbi:hypothetical protein HK104_006084 [Borealophlyctis nickersoniae]|nr:hypothetical protein HK104_006084 [Borealophlyctis nickersoniae]